MPAESEPAEMKTPRPLPAGASRGPVATGVAPRLYERACSILASQIAGGQLSPGSRLLESHVAEQFGISRAPARQALARLESLGLLRRSAGHGYVVEQVKEVPPQLPVPAGTGAPIRLAAESTWERIYVEVEQDIVSRTAFGAWRVVENHLAGYYGVSRTVAREVLSRLQQRGIVKKDQKQRWYAPALNRDYVAELYEMRALLEPQALAKAADRLPPGTAQGLRHHLETAIDRADTLDGTALSALETELHVDLLAHCGNATLMEAVTTYQSLLVAHTFLYHWAPQLYAPEPFLAEHLAVAERLDQGRVADAAEALRAHLDASLERAMHRLEVVRREFLPMPLPYLLRI